MGSTPTQGNLLGAIMSIIVSCPNCFVQGKVPNQVEGKIIRCKKCRMTFPVIPQLPFASITEPQRRKSSGRRTKWIVLVSLFCIIVVGVLILIISNVSSSIVSINAPDTCKEAVERLNAKGLHLRWHTMSNKVPTILIADNDDPKSYTYGFNSDLKLDKSQKFDPLPDIADGIPIGVNFGLITQYPTSTEAKEVAGTRKNAVVWGRFLITGNSELIKKVQSCL